MNEIKIFFAILLNSITFIIVVGFECIFNLEFYLEYVNICLKIIYVI